MKPPWKARGKLFLAGGGSDLDSFAFDRAFFNALNGGKIVYLPIAWPRDEAGYRESYRWFTGMISRHGAIPEVEMWLDLSENTKASLASVKAIYIGGGNTFALLKLLTESKFDQVLIEYLSDGGIIYGGSAGAIVMGSSINTVAEENELGSQARSAGLGLLQSLSIRCHFSPADVKNVQACFKNGFVGPILCLPEKSGIVVENERLRVEGDEAATIFSKADLYRSLPVGTELTPSDYSRSGNWDLFPPFHASK